jgi:HTH-type transcriptional regulator / antitoxin HigA
MQNLDFAKTADAWAALSRTLIVPHTESEYRQLVELLDNLVDKVGEDESHPLASLMEVVGILIEKYEDEQVPELAVSVDPDQSSA